MCSHRSSNEPNRPHISSDIINVKKRRSKKPQKTNSTDSAITSAPTTSPIPECSRRQDRQNNHQHPLRHPVKHLSAAGERYLGRDGRARNPNFATKENFLRHGRQKLAYMIETFAYFPLKFALRRLIRLVAEAAGPPGTRFRIPQRKQRPRQRGRRMSFPFIPAPYPIMPPASPSPS